MNKFYDKLLLVIALLLLLGGGYLYLQKSAAVPSQGTAGDAEPADNPYQAVEVPASESTEASWPPVEAQSAGPEWIYDVFTPPKIYIDKDGQFVATPPVPIDPDAPFGVYLAEIQRKPYRLQLEGYIEEDLKDASKSLLLMFDEEAQKQVRVRPGDEESDSEFKLLSFTIERIREEGLIEKIATATILDQRSGEEVALKHNERRYDDGVTILIRSNEDPSVEVVLSEAPSEFETPSGQYQLLEINLEESSVTVEKSGVDGEESEVQTLIATQESTTTPIEQNEVEASASGSDADAEGGFDLIF